MVRAGTRPGSGNGLAQVGCQCPRTPPLDAAPGSSYPRDVTTSALPVAHPPTPDPDAGTSSVGVVTGGAVLVVGVCWSAGIALGAQPGLSVPVLMMAALAVLAALALARAPVGRLLALGLLALLL